MKKIIFLFAIGLLCFSCGTEIKNKDAKVSIEEGTNIESSEVPTPIKEKQVKPEESPLGFWVGDFKNADEENKTAKNIYVGEGIHWNRDNKINISIDQISDGLVVGHSIVAGNARPFEGTINESSDGTLLFEVKEPGDDKYDGTFTFTIKDNKLKGEWLAYKKIDISKRKFNLTKRKFTYNAEIMLSNTKRFVDWNEKIETVEYDAYDGEVEEWIRAEFATATSEIYKINASNTKLTKEVVENLKKGDLTIIRNTIYARHGYSFKNRPLRVFFDDQSWYIPVHNDIKSDFTELEKENIELLLRYEKNAATYYDRFGRG